MASSQQQFDTLEDAKPEIPGSLVNMILEYEGSDPSQGFGNVSLVRTLFSSIETQRFRKLLMAVVSGKPDEVKGILDIDRSLASKKFEEKNNIIAPSGHQFNRITPFQAALSVDDTQLATLIKSYLDKEEADRQFNEQYRKEYEEVEEKKWKRILKQFMKLVLAIRDGKQNIISSGAPDYVIQLKKGSLVEAALFEFWELLDDILDTLITVGTKPFDPCLLFTALEIFYNYRHFRHFFGDDHYDPRSLLYEKVVNEILHLMPVNYVQALQDGPHETCKNLQDNKPQGRSTQFGFYRPNSIYFTFNFYPLPPRIRASSFGPIEREERQQRFNIHHLMQKFGNGFKRYLIQKNLAFETLRPARKENEPDLNPLFSFLMM